MCRTVSHSRAAADERINVPVSKPHSGSHLELQQRQGNQPHQGHRPTSALLTWRHTALAVAVAAALALLPNIAQAQASSTSPGTGASTPGISQSAASSERPDSPSSNASAPAQSSSSSAASDTTQKAKAKASDWGDKIKTTSARLIDTTKQVFTKLAEKIPGTDAYTRAKEGSSGDKNDSSQHSSSARP